MSDGKIYRLMLERGIVVAGEALAFEPAAELMALGTRGDAPEPDYDGASEASTLLL